jgi:hypothetical protein
MLSRSLHGFFTKLFLKRVNISARARDKIPRPARGARGTRTFAVDSSQIAVKLIITGAFLNKIPGVSLETFSDEFEECSVCGALRSAADRPNPPVDSDAERVNSRRRPFPGPFLPILALFGHPL